MPTGQQIYLKTTGLGLYSLQRSFTYVIPSMSLEGPFSFLFYIAGQVAGKEIVLASLTLSLQLFLFCMSKGRVREILRDE